MWWEGILVGGLAGNWCLLYDSQYGSLLRFDAVERVSILNRGIVRDEGIGRTLLIFVEREREGDGGLTIPALTGRGDSKAETHACCLIGKKR